MNDNRHQDGIYPFPAGMQSREDQTNSAKIHVRVGGMVQRSSCCTTSA